MPVLLAPGGALNSALAAIDEGADALYLGLKGHSRGGAKGELSEEEILHCLKEAKKRGKKLYLAFNLTPAGRDLSCLITKIEYYLTHNLDGIILNEPSTIKIIARKFPSLNITASIGCAISNLQEARFYRELGAKTLVLGPRIGLEDLARIKTEIDCQVEVFVYGFHEMFTLGQCWLGGYVKSVRNAECGMWNEKTNAFNSALRTPHSAFPKSGSAKRSGVCGQVCGLIDNLTPSVGAQSRLGGMPLHTVPQPYYVLRSLKDLIAAGVDVFKLGGRYHRPENIPPLVGFYRQLLDMLALKKEEFWWKMWEDKAKKLFVKQAQELIY